MGKIADLHKISVLVELMDAGLIKKEELETAMENMTKEAELKENQRTFKQLLGVENE